MLKKSVLVVALLLIATNVWAVKTIDVSGTRHNLSSTSVNIPGGNIYMAANEDEVCIFCHTPHGGTANTPLWNRALPTGAFTHYTSTTLTTTVGASNRAVWPESLLCMSCHDGAIAMNSIINNSNRTVGGVPDAGSTGNIIPQFFTVGGAIGDAPNPGGFGFLGESRNLTDDHPISFSYSMAYDDVTNTGTLNAIGVAQTAGLRFFGPNTSTPDGNRVECSSCHDPHVNYEVANGGDAAYTPFLVRTNDASSLCLSCHIK